MYLWENLTSLLVAPFRATSNTYSGQQAALFRAPLKTHKSQLAALFRVPTKHLHKAIGGPFQGPERQESLFRPIADNTPTQRTE